MLNVARSRPMPIAITIIMLATLISAVGKINACRYIVANVATQVNNQANNQANQTGQ